MGHIVITRRWVVERHLELSIEDVQKREERQERDCGTFPAIFGWHRRFTEHLEKCPHCGRSPQLMSRWCPKWGFDYKYICDEGYMDCGDHYPQLSRAGLDWNYRVREAKGGPHRHAPHLKVKCDAYGRRRKQRKQW